MWQHLCVNLDLGFFKVHYNVVSTPWIIKQDRSGGDRFAHYGSNYWITVIHSYRWTLLSWQEVMHRCPFTHLHMAVQLILHQETYLQNLRFPDTIILDDFSSTLWNNNSKEKKVLLKIKISIDVDIRLVKPHLHKYIDIRHCKFKFYN